MFILGFILGGVAVYGAQQFLGKYSIKKKEGTNED